jgi:AcrR family transcriptional regulator
MTTTVAADRGDQRARILGVALDLMANNGVAGTSMRQLSNACGLNVATLYHYFPSKADLLRAVIADRNYDELLRVVSIPVDMSLAPRPRLERFLRAVWSEALSERPVWRLLVGESLRGDADALEVVRDLATNLDAAIDRWLGEAFPELPGDHTVVSSVLSGQLLSFLLEDLVLPERDRRARLTARIAATAALVFP